MIDDRIIKVKVPRGKRKDGLPTYPFTLLESTPPRFCVFDSYHGTIGFDVYPFALTTRVAASGQIFIKVYEENTCIR